MNVRAMSHLRPGQRELLFDDVDFVGKSRRITNMQNNKNAMEGNASEKESRMAKALGQI